MTRVLITAFEPYDSYQDNASWLTLVELTREMPTEPKITTRRYPVDFSQVKHLLAKDLADKYDVALHLGQAPGRTCIEFESIALNVRSEPAEKPGVFRPLAEDGPVAYQSELPLTDWAATLTAAGIPARVSHHAGTFVCNATLYWSQYFIEQMSLPTRATFVHLPLDVSQTAASPSPGASLPANLSAKAIRYVLDDLKTS